MVKMLSCPSSQCFQRNQGPRKMKSEGLDFLLSANVFPKPAGLAPTPPTSYTTTEYPSKGHDFLNNNLDYLCKALKYRHFRGYGQGIYYRFTTFTERALICAAPREPDARRGRHTDRPPTMTISYTDHDGVSSLPTRGEKGRRFFYALCYAVGA